MQIRISRVRRGDKTYEYPQLVESYRRKSDGMPTHRVITSLAHLSEIEIDNLKAALDASRQGKKVVVASALSRRMARPTRPVANLKYLDMAVLLEMWRQWRLDELFDELLPVGDALVKPSAVLAALAIHRCVDPGSKLYAERWFPRTALPELLGVAPAIFNNTRIHRVLDGLDQNGYQLMAKLPRLYKEQDGAFVALFADVTDTWFVGHGPKMAEHAKTKEGMIRLKVGIVLLCNEHGYPLRWEVIRGKESDKDSIARMAHSIGGLSWVGNAPLVCDRAMGNTAQIRQLLEARLHFLTALTLTEFSAYTDAIPHRPFADFMPVMWANEKEKAKEVARAAQLTRNTPLEKVDDRLYVLDLGNIERPADGGAVAEQTDEENVDKTIEAMRLGRQMRESVAEGRVNSLAAAGRRVGLGPSVAKKYRRLANLSEDIQFAVLDGKAIGVPISRLLNLEIFADLDKQQRAFEVLAKEAAGREDRPRGLRETSWPQTTPVQPAGGPVRVRAVTYFNPEMLVEQRRRAQDTRKGIDGFIKQLNRRLARPRSRMNKNKILAEVYQKLRRHDLIEVYEVDIDSRHDPKGGHPKFVVRLTLKPEKWASRRRYDGFSLLVAHPDVELSAIELCRLYRAKDKVEKDFETIKSFVKLRPIRHRLDAKVRAHVSICMLALLLERTLAKRISAGNSAQRTLEELATCHLNRYSEGEAASAYGLTELTDEQDAILRQLQLRLLANDVEIADRITPR
jgi:hypothetical protein